MAGFIALSASSDPDKGDGSGIRLKRGTGLSKFFVRHTVVVYPFPRVSIADPPVVSGHRSSLVHSVLLDCCLDCGSFSCFGHGSSHSHL